MLQHEYQENILLIYALSVQQNIDIILDRFKDEDIIGDGLLQDMRDLVDFYRSGCKSNKLSEEKTLRLRKWIHTYLQVTKTVQGKKKRIT